MASGLSARPATTTREYDSFFFPSGSLSVSVSDPNKQLVTRRQNEHAQSTELVPASNVEASASSSIVSRVDDVQTFSKKSMLAIVQHTYFVTKKVQLFENERPRLIKDNAVLKSQIALKEQTNPPPIAEDVDIQLHAIAAKLKQVVDKLLAFEDKNPQHAKQLPKAARLLPFKDDLSKQAYFCYLGHLVIMGFKADADIKWNKEVIAARHQTIGQKFETEMPIPQPTEEDLSLISEACGEDLVKKFKDLKNEMIPLEAENKTLSIRYEELMEGQQETQEFRQAHSALVLTPYLTEFELTTGKLPGVKKLQQEISSKIKAMVELQNIAKRGGINSFGSHEELEYHRQNFSIALEGVETLKLDIERFIKKIEEGN